jgi:hypothetical protein
MKIKEGNMKGSEMQPTYRINGQNRDDKIGKIIEEKTKRGEVLVYSGV